MTIRTPNFVLIAAFSHAVGPHDVRILEAGTFVRPINVEYVPKHVLDNPANKYFNKSTDSFCYTRYGIISIPKSYLREA